MQRLLDCQLPQESALIESFKSKLLSCFQDAGSKSFGGKIQSASKSDDVQLSQGLLERHSLGKDDKRLLESLADGTLHDSLSSGEFLICFVIWMEQPFCFLKFG